MHHIDYDIYLQESNISRYNKEFHEVCLIGSGQFGSVYKCINRLDGLAYAVKKSIRPVAGSFLEKRALNEVYAHAVLGKLASNTPSVKCIIIYSTVILNLLFI